MLTKEQLKFNAQSDLQARRAVCKRCHVIMCDAENATLNGDFFHPVTFKNGKPNSCKNAGRCLDFGDDSKELELFVPKKMRRKARGLGVQIVDKE